MSESGNSVHRGMARADSCPQVAERDQPRSRNEEAWSSGHRPICRKLVIACAVLRIEVFATSETRRHAAGVKTVSRKRALETGADIRVERPHSVNGDGYRTPRMARNGAVSATTGNSERESRLGWLRDQDSNLDSRSDSCSVRVASGRFRRWGRGGGSGPLQITCDNLQLSELIPAREQTPLL
jgi:hypothetical protein